ncbi:MAG: multidrug efflux SMR transporter [Alphaproteobacteria bacterium]
MNTSSLGPWSLLVVAGLLEVVWALGFKYVPEKSPWIVPVYIALIASFWLLVDALKQLPAGTAYAVWTGIGAVGVAVIGMVFFHEPATLVRIGCIALIVIGIGGLKLTHAG